jgi:hydrogenase maturation factor HypE
MLEVRGWIEGQCLRIGGDVVVERSWMGIGGHGHYLANKLERKRRRRKVAIQMKG